jgi:large subunit ribosomal protein L19
MVEEKKDKVSAEAENQEAGATKGAEEKLEPQKTEEQKVEKKEEKTVEAKAEAKIEEKEVKPDEVEEDKPQKSNLIGDLNFLPEVRNDLPEIKSGDVLKVSYRVIEGGKERTQLFEGTVIAIKNSGITKTITVRKTSFGIAVERIFPLNSKLVQSILITKHSKVRRAKLYYLRNLKGKAARLKELR